MLDNNLLAMYHNQGVYKQAQEALNSIIRAVKSCGGTVWIQSKSDKEKCYILDEEISICSYQPLNSK